MLAITGDRGSGKTTALVAVFKEDPNGLLVFSNMEMMHYAFRKWDWIKSRPVISLGYLKNAIQGWPPNTRLYLDELTPMDIPEEVRHMVAACCKGQR